LDKVSTVAGGGDVSKVGTPENNQLGVWTGDGTIEGVAALTYDDTTFAITSITTLATTTISNLTVSSDLTLPNDSILDAMIDWGNLTDLNAGGEVAWGNLGAGELADNSVQADDIDTINCGTNCTWDAINDEIDIDDKFLKNDATDIGVGLTLTGDNASVDTNYVPNVLYNTDDTPPAASGFPIGTIYIQYTP